MRTFKAVLSGFVVASALILAAGWAFGLLATPAMRGGYSTPSLTTAMLALVYTGVSIVVGTYVATRIHDASETLGGFAVVQAFFGFGLIREFWSGGSSWYGVAALILVIPCAILGRALARSLGGGEMAGLA